MSRGVTPEEAARLIEFTPLARRADPHEGGPDDALPVLRRGGLVTAGTFACDGGMTATMPAPHETYNLGDFTFADGQTLPETQIAYATYGELNEARDNVVVLPTWFVGTHADHEWMIGDGGVLDTNRYFVVVPSLFGNGLSSSPSNTSAPFDRGRFPRHSIQDNVRAQHRLVTEHLGVTGIELVIGGLDGCVPGVPVGAQPP